MFNTYYISTVQSISLTVATTIFQKGEIVFFVQKRVSLVITFIYVNTNSSQVLLMALFSV